MKSKIESTLVLALVSSTHFLGTSEAYVAGQPQTSSLPRNSPIASGSVSDTANIGSLVVPTVGIGTISWSSDSLFELESKELENVVGSAYGANAAFFDTAESKLRELTIFLCTLTLLNSCETFAFIDRIWITRENSIRYGLWRHRKTNKEDATKSQRDPRRKRNCTRRCY